VSAWAKRVGPALAVAALLALAGQFLGAGAAPAWAVVALALVVGGILGATAALTYLGGQPERAFRIGTVAIVLVGGVAVFAATATARAFVPAFTAGGIVGAAALVLALGASDGAGEGGDHG
jgi:hypothetical protein